MDDTTKAGFRLGIRVAARLLIEAAEEFEAQATVKQLQIDRSPATDHIGLPALVMLRSDLESKARLLRYQADIIRATKPEQVHVHRS